MSSQRNRWAYMCTFVTFHMYNFLSSVIIVFFFLEGEGSCGPQLSKLSSFCAPPPPSSYCAYSGSSACSFLWLLFFSSEFYFHMVLLVWVLEFCSPTVLVVHSFRMFFFFFFFFFFAVVVNFDDCSVHKRTFVVISFVWL